MNEAQVKLALEILNCPMVKAVQAAKDSIESTQYACHEIIRFQEKDYAQKVRNMPFQFQLPEPWNGDISAPILFIGSNPGFNPEEKTVTEQALNSDKEAALNHFGTRLDNDKWPKGDYPDFFRYIQEIASKILQRLKFQPEPEKTYHCSTEIVHCKSNGEVGVSCAATHCIERWLKRLLNISGAKLVILVGGTTQTYCNSYFKTNLGYGQVQEVKIGERPFLFTSIYHNNARFKGVGEKKESALENILKELESNYPNILSTIRSLAD